MHNLHLLAEFLAHCLWLPECWLINLCDVCVVCWGAVKEPGGSGRLAEASRGLTREGPCQRRGKNTVTPGGWRCPMGSRGGVITVRHRASRRTDSALVSASSKAELSRELEPLMKSQSPRESES
jgi:hypothetical protein